MDTQAGIDWLSVTSLNDTTMRNPNLGLQYVELERGFAGYQNAVRFLDGRIENVSPEQPRMGTHMIYSGEVLRTIHREVGRDSFDIAGWHYAMGHRASRVDICIDVRDSGMSITGLNDLVVAKEHRSFCQSALHIKESIATGETLWFAKGQKKQLKIYDKGAESGQGGDWIRVEMEIKQKYAQPTVKRVVEAADKGKEIGAMIRGFVDFDDKLWLEALGNNISRVSVKEKTDTDARLWLLTDVASCMAKQLFAGDTTMMTDFNDAVQRKLLDMIDSIKH